MPKPQTSIRASTLTLVPGNRRKETEMNAYLITYKVSRMARLEHTCVRFYPDYETACTNSERVLAETYPDVVILSVEPIADPRKEAGR